MKLSRRELSLMLPAVAAAQTKQTSALPSKCYQFEELPVKKNGVNEQRAILDGRTHTGYPIEVHITELGPGMMPHAAHHHAHEEMVMLRSGQLDVTIKDVTTRITAGSVVYVNSNEEHGWKNPGPDRAQYFVIAVGKE